MGIAKGPIVRDRIRHIAPGFGWVDHRLVRGNYGCGWGQARSVRVGTGTELMPPDRWWGPVGTGTAARSRPAQSFHDPLDD